MRPGEGVSPLLMIVTGALVRYESAVDIDSIEDPVQRRATISIINNFGQTPKQVFKKPHPSRKVAAGDRSAGCVLSSRAQLKRLVQGTSTTARDVDGPVGQIVISAKGATPVGKNRLLLPPQNLRCLDWNRFDFSISSYSIESEKVRDVWRESVVETSLVSTLIPSQP